MMKTKIIMLSIAMFTSSLSVNARADSILIYSEYLKTQPAISWDSIESMYDPGVKFNFYRNNTSFSYKITLNPYPQDFSFNYNNIYYEQPESFVLQCEFLAWGDSNADISAPVNLSKYIVKNVELKDAAIIYEYSEMFDAIFVNGYGALNIYGELNPNPIPEPSSIALFSISMGVLALWRRKYLSAT